MFSVSDGPTNDIKTQFFRKKNLSIVLVMVKYIQLHYTKPLPKQLIGHKFVEIEFSKSNQKKINKMTEFGTKRQSEISNRVFPNKSAVSTPECCRQRQFCIN